MAHPEERAAAAVAAPAELASVYRLAESDLAQVGKFILDRLTNADATIGEILRYSFRLGGKRLRPLLLILAARACGRPTREHYLCAAALEMIHTGSLVHDDILDGARFRRHLETLNLHWDSHFAVLAGDLLLTKAITLITECGRPEVYPIVADACRRTCEGELLQVSCQGRLDLTRAEYDRIIEGKTAALLEASCRLGALLAGQSEGAVGLFTRFGRALGMAFQIFDDVLDLTGTDAETGKTLGTDLLNRKLTLPAIHFLQTAPESETSAFLDLLHAESFGPDEAEKARVILLASRSVDYARRTALDMVRGAVDLLEEFRRGITDQDRLAALDSLRRIAEFIADRNK